MRLLRPLLLVVLLLALLAPDAPAYHRLSTGEAARAIGGKLRRSFPYGAEPGSLLAYCGRRSRYHVRCDILFRDLGGDTWCGGAGVRAVGFRNHRLRVSWDVSMRGCQYF